MLYYFFLYIKDNLVLKSYFPPLKSALEIKIIPKLQKILKVRFNIWFGNWLEFISY